MDAVEETALHGIRRATTLDCRAATALCMRSKASWGYDEQFMEQSRDALTLTPERVEGWTVLVAEDPEGNLSGVAAAGARDTRRDAELELLFVEPDCMGRGVGAALMEEMAARLVVHGVEVLWILSDPGAEPFYRRLGAARAGLRPSDAIPGRMLPWLRLDLVHAAPWTPLGLGTSAVARRFDSRTARGASPRPSDEGRRPGPRRVALGSRGSHSTPLPAAFDLLP